METLGKGTTMDIPKEIPTLAFLFQSIAVWEGIYQDGGIFCENAYIQGAGIYRNMSLTSMNLVHFKKWNMYVMLWNW